jgi:hypothetical protein
MRCYLVLSKNYGRHEAQEDPTSAAIKGRVLDDTAHYFYVRVKGKARELMVARRSRLGRRCNTEIS